MADDLHEVLDWDCGDYDDRDYGDDAPEPMDCGGTQTDERSLLWKPWQDTEVYPDDSRCGTSRETSPVPVYRTRQQVLRKVWIPLTVSLVVMSFAGGFVVGRWVRESLVG